LNATFNKIMIICRIWIVSHYILRYGRFLSTIVDFTVIVTVGLVWLMVINATFTLVEETGVPGENHRPVASH